jgi:hypothetical protein
MVGNIYVFSSQVSHDYENLCFSLSRLEIPMLHMIACVFVYHYSDYFADYWTNNSAFKCHGFWMGKFAVSG